MIFISTWERLCHSYFTHYARSDHLTVSKSFCSSMKIFDALKYLGMYKFVYRMGTDTSPASMAFYQCIEMHWKQTAAKDGIF